VGIIKDGGQDWGWKEWRHGWGGCVVLNKVRGGLAKSWEGV
jgi:hypothetical protein